jgi:hypothetical protein
MYSVHFQTDAAEPEAVKAVIGHAMEQYAKADLIDNLQGISKNSGQRISNVVGPYRKTSGPRASQISGMVQMSGRHQRVSFEN